MGNPSQYLLCLRFKLRQTIAREILRWRLIRLWMAERRPLLLFVRFGGIGDIICSLPAYAAVCRANPATQGVFVTRSAYQSLPLLIRAPGSICLSRIRCPIPRLPRWLVYQTLTPQYSDELGHPSSSFNLVDEFYRACGLQAEAQARLRFYFPPGRAKEVCASLNLDTGGAAKCVVIHTGPSWKVREWPAESWQVLVDGLRKALPSVRIFQIGANAQLDANKPAPSVHNIESLVGKLSLAEMAAFLAGVDLFVGIDSGMIHMAVAAGTAVVGLFGPTNPGRIPQDSKTIGMWHPLPCSFCHHRQPRLHFRTGCPHGIACMKDLEPARVLQMCLNLLNRPLVFPANTCSRTALPAVPPSSMS